MIRIGRATALCGAISAAALLLSSVPASAEGHDHSQPTAGSNFGTGTGMVYPDPVDSRTFDRYLGEWSQQRGSRVCSFLAYCATADGFWFFNGTNGMARVQINGASAVGGTISHTWTSPEFVYDGHAGQEADENVVQYRIRANTEKLRSSELAGGQYQVQVVDSAGTVVAQNAGRELIPQHDWRMRSFSVPATRLKIGGTYRLRAVTKVAKEHGSSAGGTVDWDCVSVTARSGEMTGTEGCGAGDTPPDPGEWVMSGGSSPVCNSALDPLAGPLLETLEQIFVGPNQLAAGIGDTTGDLVDAILDPARPFAVALGDLTGTFAATTTGLSGPAGQLAEALQPFTEAVAQATNPVSGAASGFLTPLAELLSDTAGNVTKPAGELLGVVLSPLGSLATPLIPIYDSLVRPVTEPFVSTIMDSARPAMVAALGPEATEAVGHLIVPLQEAATGTVGPFNAAIGSLHPVHATLVNLLDPVYTSTMTTLGPDAASFTSFLHGAYVHSFPSCGEPPKTGPDGENGHH